MKTLYKNWLVHNVVAHPAMQILSMLRFSVYSAWVHDITLPENED